EPLTFKGVVFNEMKGVYSSPDSRFYRIVQQALFPDNTYRHDSGGDPEDIPDLSYTKFQQFHEKYYHPSNARFWFYGDDEPLKRLELLDGFLSEFERRDVDSAVETQVRREQILGTSIKDFKVFADAIACVKGEAGRVAVVTSAEKAKAVLAERPGFWELKKVL
ncbi:Presequence protease 1, chloroplastic/mitochondrial, partial [Tetrabaena socialis]